MEIIKLKYAETVPENYTGIVEWENGKKEWYKEGLLHREDGPAVEYADGTKSWYKEGLLHREDGPACEYPKGSKYWYKEDKLHRIDGPAFEHANGTKFWYIDGRPANVELLKLLVSSFLYFGKEKGIYNLYWLKFFTEKGIKMFPIIPGMEIDFEFKQIFDKLSLEI